MKQEYKNIAKTSLIIALIYTILTSPVAAHKFIVMADGLNDKNFTAICVIFIILTATIFLIWSFYTFFMLVALFSKWGYRVKHYNKIGYPRGTPSESARFLFFVLLPFLSLFFMIKFCIYLISYY